MVTIYTVCAIVGSTILVLQLLLTAIGVDGDSSDIAEIGDDLEMGDEIVDSHASSSAFFGILSFRSIVAAVALFGIGGRAGLEAGLWPYFALLLAIAMGVSAMFLVAWLMKVLHSLKSDGTVRIENCIGLPATVYLGIPGAQSGKGKVTVSVQNRTMEYAAVTSQDQIPTGAHVVVVGIAGLDTLEVATENES